MDGSAARQRLGAQLLSGPPATAAEAVVERLLAVQAQDGRGARLAVRARSKGLSARDVDDALTHDRSLVVTWLNRGTLHLVLAADYWWLHALTAPPLMTSCRRRLQQLGVADNEAERGVSLIERALAGDGPLPRPALRDRLAAAGVPVEGQALVHLLFLASLRGLVVRGPMVGAEHAFALVPDWLGRRPEPVDRDTALARLARRYLAGHGPADDRDLAKWSGLPLRDTRRGLSLIADELTVRADGLVDLAAREVVDETPPPRLLGAYEPSLLGWVSREPVVGEHRELVTVNGLFRPFALVDGRAAATWRLDGDGVALAPFRPLPPATEAALQADAVDVRRFLSG